LNHAIIKTKLLMLFFNHQNCDVLQLPNFASI